MIRIVIGLILGLILSLTMVTSVLAAPPDSLVVVTKSGQPPIINGSGTDGVPPPEITIILPSGQMIQPGPPD